MGQTAIMTDTNSGISAADARERNIFMIPMPVLVDGATFFEGQDIDHGRLFEMMKEDADVSTSQPSPGIVLDMWENILKEYDELVYIPMSSGLSGSCETARALSADFGGRVRVADTHRISVTMKDCVYDAVKLGNDGLSADEITAALEENAYNSVVYLGVDTLKYFRKNGRVTAGAAALATVLNIKPILITEGGKFDTFAKVRGIKACKERIIEAGLAELDKRFAAFSKDEINVSTAGTFETDEESEEWRTQVESAFPGHHVIYDKLSCSIACHTGIGAVGLAMSRICR
ncbi:MAG: DegV family protein [Oscillospiraceae bacterium]|nr:DegV family protein [Oscillospiraceae bacterium]